MVRDRGLPALIVNPSIPVGPRDIKPTPTGRMIAEPLLAASPISDTSQRPSTSRLGGGSHAGRSSTGCREKYILGGEDFSLAALLGLFAELAGRQPPRVRLTETVLWPVASGQRGPSL